MLFSSIMFLAIICIAFAWAEPAGDEDLAEEVDTGWYNYNLH